MKNLLILLLVAVIMGYVTRVKDGDSFLMRSKGVIHEIRLYGIDAPEYRQEGGKAAKKALHKLISGKTIKVEAISTGKYNRIIGKVYVGKKYINLELVKNGYVHWYKRYASKDADLESAQQRAKDSKLVIWGHSTPPILPEIYRRRHFKKNKSKNKNVSQSSHTKAKEISQVVNE